jgi:hypothetical protein
MKGCSWMVLRKREGEKSSGKELQKDSVRENIE